MRDATTTPSDNPGRRAAAAIARGLREAGHVAYFAGGCVRDELLGLTPSDYDVATDAPPERVRELFHNSRYVGEAFGVVLVRLMGQEVEVATFRTEWGYVDGRRPGEVRFSDARHDAARRDFTINGLFEDPQTNEIIDFVGGQDDLRAGVIRAIGVADDRFAEDYLRMLRAVRFAARLDFTLESQTEAAIRKHADKLAGISRERIGQEIEWMLTGPRPAKAAAMLQSLGLDGPALLDESLDVPLPTVAALGAAPVYPCVLAAWLFDRQAAKLSVPPPQCIRCPEVESFVAAARQRLNTWRKALCLSNDVRDAVAGILAHLPEAVRWEQLPVARRKRLLARPHWANLWTLLRAMQPAFATAPLVAMIDRESPPLFAQGVAPPPLINGDDLVAMGLQPGPDFRRILDTVYDEQLEGLLTSRDEALARLKQLV